VSERPLAETFRRLIRATGPISLARYMGESNAHYYSTRDPLGRAQDTTGGDFTTAPEISQMFGELVGLWLTDLWDRAGRPGRVVYAELGPGRGTLAKDALRAMAAQGLRPDVHFVEGSPALRKIQQGAVAGAQFHDDTTTLPGDAPILLVANEFFDALPVRQLVRSQTGWRERMVGLDDDGAFRFVAGDQPMKDIVPPDRREAEAGAIIETCPAASAIMRDISARIAAQGGAMLTVDYGYTAAQTGSTLQAVRAHRKVDPLSAPGEADLTALVDFAALAQAVDGARHDGTITQGELLRALGIDHRAGALARAAPGQEASLLQAAERLAGDDQMGSLFKAMALTAPDWPPPAAFAAEPSV